jgi:hypothetical protein
VVSGNGSTHETSIDGAVRAPSSRRFTTLYLQTVLHFGPLVTSFVLAFPDLPRWLLESSLAHRGAHTVLLVALLIQGGSTAPMILLGTQPVWLWLLIPALFIGVFGHITAVIAATVTATSEVPDSHKGLVTTSQRVAVTVGIPLLGAVRAIRADLLAGIHLALAADVLLTLMAVILIHAGLSRREPTVSPPIDQRRCNRHGNFAQGRPATASDKPEFRVLPKLHRHEYRDCGALMDGTAPMLREAFYVSNEYFVITRAVSIENAGNPVRCSS